MKRTTLVLDDDLFRQIKQEAARQGETLKAFLNSLLRRVLSAKKPAKPYKLELRPFKNLLKPGINIADRNELYEIMDGRR